MTLSFARWGLVKLSTNRKSVGTVVLQQAVYPESIIDRLSHFDNKNSESMIKYQKPNACGAPLKASNGGYLTATFTQLCHSSPTILTAFVVDNVAKLQRQSTRLVFIHIDAVVGTENRNDQMLVIRLNGRSLDGGFAIKTTEVMRITWEKDKLNFNPPDGKTSSVDLRMPRENSRNAIGGRLTVTISDEGTVAHFSFTLGSSARPTLSKRLLLPTHIDNGLELIAEVRT
ncbi:unnamed protein product [Rodentolepis nana]|uniref:Glyco_hydro_38C domain-containing protein n=1 Tax=Rodentolepis nana TaxID=102285 RepID=A0A0R3TIE8_RODNA|nr:unnamed protein product [Rodentolepis nana]